MATTTSIQNLGITRTDDFNNKSISNITTHECSFTLVGDSTRLYICTLKTDGVTWTKNVYGGSLVNFAIGTFDSGNSDMIEKTIDIYIGSLLARSFSIQVYKYSPPDVTAAIARNASEQPVLTFIPTYQATVADAANTLKQFWARCVVNDEIYQTDLKDKTSPQVLIGTYDIAKSYQFLIVIQDQVKASATIKKIVLPSDIPVMDIGADGKTVTFFGTSPNSADKNTLRIGDVASFGEDVVLGDTSNSYTVVNSNGLTVHDKNTVVGDETDVIAAIGIGNAVNASGSNITGPFYTLGVRNYDENSKNGLYSTAEGWLNTASGYASHAEGNNCVASGHTAHAGGMSSTASGNASFAHGYNVRASSPRQAVFGVNNITDDAGKYLFIVGNGYDDAEASNAFGVMADGHVDVKKNIYINTNGSGIFGKDSEGTKRELMAMDGNNTLSIGYGQYEHGSRGTVLQGGNVLTFRLKNPSVAWQPYLRSGDSFNLYIHCSGYITNGKSNVWFFIPLSRPVIGAPTITVASTDGLCVRQNDKYLYGSGASSYAKPKSYSCYVSNANHIVVNATMSNTTNVTNNSPCGIAAGIKITFS